MEKLHFVYTVYTIYNVYTPPKNTGFKGQKINCNQADNPMAQVDNETFPGIENDKPESSQGSGGAFGGQTLSDLLTCTVRLGPLSVERWGQYDHFYEYICCRTASAN